MEPATTDRIQRMIDDEATERFPALLDPEEDELARGFAPLMVQLGPADMATLDALITSGITVSRSAGARWVLARVREQSAYAELSGRPREASGLNARAGMDRITQDPRQSELDARVKELSPTTRCSGSRCCTTATTPGSSRETGPNSGRLAFGHFSFS